MQLGYSVAIADAKIVGKVVVRIDRNAALPTYQQGSLHIIFDPLDPAAGRADVAIYAKMEITHQVLG